MVGAHVRKLSVAVLGSLRLFASGMPALDATCSLSGKGHGADAASLRAYTVAADSIDDGSGIEAPAF